MRSFFNTRNFLIISIVFVYALTVSNTHAQNLSLSQSSGFRGQSISLTISSSSVTFQQSSPTICPSSLNVTTSDIVFEQASSTSFTPTFISTYNGVITANIDIPVNVQTGSYNVIIGGSGACPVFQNYAFYVNDYNTTISPYSGSIGQTLDVTVSGYGIDFHQGSSTVCPNHLNVTTSNVVFKQGSSTIYPSSVNVSSGSFQTSISIPLNASKGYYDLVIDDGGSCPYTRYNAFYVSGPYVQIYPSTGSLNQSLNVSITGTNVDFIQGSTTICPNHLNITASDIQFRQGSTTVIYPSSVTVNNGQIDAQIDIPSNAPYGNYDLYILSGSGCDIVQYNEFYIMEPYINVNPSSGIRNANLSVTISGSGINFQQGSSTICPNILNVTTSDITFKQGSSTLFHPTNVSVTNGDIIADISIPSNAALGYYDIIIGDGETCPFTSHGSFYITQPYLYLFTNPNEIIAGETLNVYITGSGIDFHQGSPTICPNHLEVTTSDVLFQQGSSTIYPSNITLNNGEIIAELNLPSNASGWYDLVVGSGTGCSISKSAAIFVSTPYINNSIYKANRNQTLDVTVTGHGIDFTQGSSTVCPNHLNVSTSNVVFYQGSSTYLYPSDISIINPNQISIKLTIPDNAPTGSYNLQVAIDGSCSYTSSCLYINDPAIFTAPSVAAINETLNVTITGNEVEFYQGSSTICPSHFNVTTSNIVFRQGSSTIYPTNVTLNNAGEIVATVSIPSNASLGYYDVIVGDGEACPISQKNGLDIIPPYISCNQFGGFPGEAIDLLIKGHGISFTEGTISNCPTSIDISPSNTILKFNSYIIYPTIVKLNSDGEIECLFEIPSDAPSNLDYELIAGWQEICPDSLQFPIGIVEANTQSTKEVSSIFSLYPNPTDGSLINLDIKQQGTYNISIIDPYGQEVGRGSVNGPGNINLSEYTREKLNPGIYFVTISNESTNSRQKFIVR